MVAIGRFIFRQLCPCNDPEFVEAISLQQFLQRPLSIILKILEILESSSFTDVRRFSVWRLK
jgi:hypothetical protein